MGTGFCLYYVAILLRYHLWVALQGKDGVRVKSDYLLAVLTSHHNHRLLLLEYSEIQS